LSCQKKLFALEPTVGIQSLHNLLASFVIVPTDGRIKHCAQTAFIGIENFDDGLKVASRDPSNENGRLVDRLVLGQGIERFFGMDIALHRFGLEIDKENILAKDTRRKFDHDFIGPDFGLAKIIEQLVLCFVLGRHCLLELFVDVFGKFLFKRVTAKPLCNFHLLLFVLVDVIISVCGKAQAMEKTGAFTNDAHASPSSRSQ
jgi:hypothetical protein